MNSESFRSSYYRGVVNIEREGMNGDRYAVIPKNFWSSCGSSGGGILWIASTFLGSG